MPEDDEAARPRNKKDARARIQELAKLRRDAEASAFQAEMKNAALEAELERLRHHYRHAAGSEGAGPQGDFDYGSVDPAYLDALVEYIGSSCASRTSLQRDGAAVREGLAAARWPSTTRSWRASWRTDRNATRTSRRW